MSPRWPFLLVPLTLLACDDHFVGDCEDASAQAYSPTITGVDDFIADKCIQCHDSGGVGQIYDKQGNPAEALATQIRIDLEDGDDSNNVLVIPGDPENSLLWLCLTWTDTAIRPMPEGATVPLAACTSQHIREWIADGASLTPELP